MVIARVIPILQVILKFMTKMAVTIKIGLRTGAIRIQGLDTRMINNMIKMALMTNLGAIAQIDSTSYKQWLLNMIRSSQMIHIGLV